jgi:hypothetical protein
LQRCKFLSRHGKPGLSPAKGDAYYYYYSYKEL